MPSNNFDIFLRFLLDQAAQTKTESGVKSMNQSLDDTQKLAAAIDKTFAQFEERIKNATSVKELESLERQFKDIKDVIGEAEQAAKQKAKEVAKAAKQEADAIKHVTHEAHLQMEVFDAQAMKLSAQASLLTKRSSELSRISSRVTQFSRTGLVTGTAVVGGIFAEANRFAQEVNNTEKATDATRAWTRETEKLAKARARVDSVLLREALPLLQQAARVANQAAAFVEKHPEIVEASLKVGAIVAGLGAIGLAVSKGIQLKADQLYLAAVPIQLEAAQLQIAAAEQMLIAANLQAKSMGADIVQGIGGKVAGAGGAAGAGGVLSGAVLSTIATTIVALLGGAAIGDKIGDAIAKKIDPKANDWGLQDYLTEAKQIVAMAAGGAGLIVSKTGGVIRNGQREVDPELGDKWFQKVAEGLGLLKKESDDAAKSVDEVANSLGNLAGSEHEKEIVDAFTQWKEDDARLVQEAADKRVKIVADAEKRVTAETARYTQQIASINTGADKRAASITSEYYKAQAKAEAQYQEQRAKLIRDSNQEIRDIEEEHKERLRKLTQEHDERVEELTAQRDALGLVKENRRFAQAKVEANRGTREEIAQRKQQLAERLQQLRQEHEAEQAERYAEFQERLAENEAQRQEELKQAAAQHAEELKQIRDQRAQQLKELAETLNAERLRRREMFVAQVRDLDAALLGERNMKVQYYNLMLQDANAWLANYRRILSSLPTATAPTHDYTGYAFSGMYRMAANGQPEYVLSGAATRAAEKIIGGGLTQDAVLATLARGAGMGSSRSLTIQDNSRFDGRISNSQVMAIKREMRDEVIKEFLHA